MMTSQRARDFVVCHALLDTGQPCGAIIAEEVGGVWIVKHRGGRWVGIELLEATCPQCGAAWRRRE